MPAQNAPFEYQQLPNIVTDIFVLFLISSRIFLDWTVKLIGAVLLSQLFHPLFTAMTPSLVQEYLHNSDEELDLSKPLILMDLNSSRQLENIHSE